MKRVPKMGWVFANHTFDSSLDMDYCGRQTSTTTDCTTGHCSSLLPSSHYCLRWPRHAAVPRLVGRDNPVVPVVLPFQHGGKKVSLPPKHYHPHHPHSPSWQMHTKISMAVLSLPHIAFLYFFGPFFNVSKPPLTAIISFRNTGFSVLIFLHHIDS